MNIGAAGANVPMQETGHPRVLPAGAAENAARDITVRQEA